jgi:hypothetical protein
MMIPNNRRSPLQWTLSATAFFLAASCAGNPSSPIMADLLSGSQVCLALDWGSALRPDFFGWTVPDTMLLLPKISENRWEALEADAEGRVGVAASQPDRKGGGWIWWTRSDTLWISSQSPTMDDLVIEVVRLTGRSRVSWKGTSMSENERGHLDLEAYPCGGLSESSP